MIGKLLALERVTSTLTDPSDSKTVASWTVIAGSCCSSTVSTKLPYVSCVIAYSNVVASPPMASTHRVLGGGLVPSVQVTTTLPSSSTISSSGSTSISLNLSTESRGRATRVFPDGSFDSLVQLVPGLNRIQIEVIGGDGGRTRAVREVFYERPPPTVSGALDDPCECFPMELVTV